MGILSPDLLWKSSTRTLAFSSSTVKLWGATWTGSWAGNVRAAAQIITTAVCSIRWGDLSGDGRKGRKIVYEASRLCPGDKEIHFSTELEQVLFLLNSV